MHEELEETPRGVCPACGNVYYDVDLRRGSDVRCDCGQRLIVTAPEDPDRPARLPD